jgi:ABC-type Fe3+/spermidine/putrescine transport system ATPase subunit
VDLAPQARGTGYVVQDLALFPHLSVAENLDFALQNRPRVEREARTRELVEMLDLEGLEDRLPNAISGGQQQRVALGRALAARPAVLLLDEPFSALDAQLRTALRREVGTLRRRLGVTAIFVTHDLAEAYSLADKIAVYDRGSVLQFGGREDVFARPADVRVAQLLDARNIFAGMVTEKTAEYLTVKTECFSARARPDEGLKPGDAASVCIRPEHVILLRRDRPHANPLDTTLDVELIDEVATGTSHRLYLRVVEQDCVLEADISAHPYQVMGVGSRRDWRIALALENTVAVRAGRAALSGTKSD